MNLTTKIRMLESAAGISEAELARRMNTTSQALGQRIKTGKFTSSELECIAEAVGAKYEYKFILQDGTEI
ncbi:MAG: XRE family transcriptional regulator [Oscillospiraceae bacterium]